MSKSINRAHKTLREAGLGLLKEVLPQEKIEEISKQHYPNIRRRALTVCVHLCLMIMVQLERSVESIEELLVKCWSLLREEFGIEVKQPVSKQAFSLRNKTLPWKIYQSIFNYLWEVYKDLRGGEEGVYKGVYQIKSMDASILEVVSRLIKVFAGTRGRGGKKRKAQVKLHTLYNNTSGGCETVFITEGKKHEIKKARSLVRAALRNSKEGKKLVIVVFDLGYFDFAFFKYIQENGGFFVSRIKENTVYEVMERYDEGDYRVRLGVTAPEQQAQVEVRLVEVDEEGKRYRYITNLFDGRITKEDIREIYKRRWEIELFFKDLKHILKTLKFHSYNENGIKIQIFCALITYLLGKILQAKVAQKYKVEVKDIKFKRVIQATRNYVRRNWKHLWRKRPRKKYMDKLLQEIYDFAYRPKDRIYQQRRYAKKCLLAKKSSCLS